MPPQFSHCGPRIFEQTLKKHAWLFNKHSPLVLSPDSDGLLCGLVLTNIYGMKVQGFYDGKVLALHPGLSYVGRTRGQAVTR